MSDLISRADAICEVLVNDGIENIVDRIKALPSEELTIQTPQTYGKSINPSNGEVVADYISRADAIDAVCRTRCGDKAKGCPAHSCLVIEEFDALPSAEAVHIETYRELYEKYVELKHASIEAEPIMPEEVREALMRLTMCAREECGMCKYKDECGYDFQYKISTDNMNTLSDALLRSKCEVDAKLADAVQGWIPCSERLPSDDEIVNITWVNHNPPPYYADIAEKPFVASGLRYCDKWYWYSSVCQDLHQGFDLIDKDIEVVAWMPLPEPYREDGEE